MRTLEEIEHGIRKLRAELHDRARSAKTEAEAKRLEVAAKDIAEEFAAVREIAAATVATLAAGPRPIFQRLPVRRGIDMYRH